MAPPAAGAGAQAIHDGVSEYYGKDLACTDDLKTSACCTEGEDRSIEGLLANVHDEVKSKFYGCGSPIPPALAGASVLDLGCGTGRDCYVAAQLVGERGSVLGVDMTTEQLRVANKHQEWHRARFGYAAANTQFRRAFIEDLEEAGVEDGSVDVVISNCVINLAPDKESVLREIHRVLKPGGELYFSDVYADRRLPEAATVDKVAVGECLGGAMYTGDFAALMSRVGFPWFRCVSERPIAVTDAGVRRVVGEATRFKSATVRAVKLPADRDQGRAEDYGQTMTYRGTVPLCPHAFYVSAGEVYVTGVETPVDGATAAAVAASRYAPHFAVSAPGPHAGPAARGGAAHFTTTGFGQGAGGVSGGDTPCC